MPRRSREFWLPLIREYEKCGASQREFAVRHGVELGTFRDWLYRRSRRAAAKTRVDNTGPRLVPVRVVATAAPGCAPNDEAAAVIAVLPSGVCVRFPLVLGAEFVADILRRLG